MHLKKSHLYLLGLIIAISLFFRTYQLVERLGFDHDGDLSAWIVKDIVVNHHYRLIGQLTSAPGVFIGALYYYLLIPFYSLTNMDPLGGVVFITIIGILSTLSYFFVFGKLFNIRVGLIAAFLQASLLSSVVIDRRVVPSTPSNLWIIWYFYTIFKISRGDFSVLPLLGLLIGLIWHIHIALAPSLLAVPIAFLISKKIPKLKQVLLSLLIFVISSFPLLIFEIRHNFSQTLSLFENFTSSHGQATGLAKVYEVLAMVSKNINTLFLSPQSLPPSVNHLFSVLILLLGVILIFRKVIPIKFSLALFAWGMGVLIFFALSSSPISEYYFYSLDIIFITIVSLIFSKLPKQLTLAIFGVILIKNVLFLVTTDIYHKGYVQKKEVVNFIIQDAKLKGYPCIGISYISAPGENVGFRYFFYLNNVHLISPSLNVPVYNIVIPEELSNEVKTRYGHIGVSVPKYVPTRETIVKSCQSPNINLTDPMLGYVY